MIRRETISAIRFGYGLGPAATPPTKFADLLRDAEQTAARRPRIPISKRAEVLLGYREARRANNDAAKKSTQRRMFRQSADDVRHLLGEAVTGPGFGERLLAFWSDHFTVAANGPPLRVLVPDFVDAGIRPHIAGQFADMLKAATLHPAMLIYLNQVQSIGPKSPAGLRRSRGLNENLAREVLELHSLGVGGAYRQEDVRGFAELLTGLSVDQTGFTYRPGISEPGPHQVLGRTYGKKTTQLRDILAALDDIAVHPDTAKHLARKLQVHFVGREFPDLTEKMATAFLASGGALPELYRVLLNDDRSWSGDLIKAKLPLGFMVSAMRASGTTQSDIDALKQTELRSGVIEMLQTMGQPMFRPTGPDGWSEEDATWITPPGLAARIRWADGFAELIQAKTDPREFLESTLADAASTLLIQAVNGAESKVEGIVLTLVSPEFNRR